VDYLNRISGVFAALLTPRDSDGNVDLDSYRHQVFHLNRTALAGYALNGATGEFPTSTEKELENLLNATREEAPDAQLLCGIGAGSLRNVLCRGRIAEAANATAVLLPMPSFFPYRQDDLFSFVSAVASDLNLPILLYNLPQFTSGLDIDTILSLFEKHPNIVGIKDSSGSLEVVRTVTAARLPYARLIGNDSALAPSRTEKVCDGVISGVACVLPELILSLYTATEGSEQFQQAEKLLNEFISRISVLPTPWGLKVASAVRGFSRETYPFPLSAQRQLEIAELRNWFKSWYQKTLA
jgi:4-hydroxy-tetrahydrodipicolinate synthase